VTKNQGMTAGLILGCHKPRDDLTGKWVSSLLPVAHKQNLSCLQKQKDYTFMTITRHVCNQQTWTPEDSILSSCSCPHHCTCQKLGNHRNAKTR